ncbi:MAG: P-II family nitrogen regulator [Chloroflexota bacterium]|nr:P-II family nitrogen regulator [Chloroflexota bacterium]
MKKIEAIIREEKLDAVRTVLEDSGYFGMTVTEVSGRGRQGGLSLQWRVGEYRVDFLSKLKIEVVVLDEDVSKILHAIATTARTGEMGDGKIFVIPIDNAVRIRTGEDGKNAI